MVLMFAMNVNVIDGGKQLYTHGIIYNSISIGKLVVEAKPIRENGGR
jgi:hypothetical protein